MRLSRERDLECEYRRLRSRERDVERERRRLSRELERRLLSRECERRFLSRERDRVRERLLCSLDLDRCLLLSLLLWGGGGELIVR